MITMPAPVNMKAYLIVSTLDIRRGLLMFTVFDQLLLTVSTAPPINRANQISHTHPPAGDMTNSLVSGPALLHIFMLRADRNSSIQPMDFFIVIPYLSLFQLSAISITIVLGPATMQWPSCLYGRRRAVGSIWSGAQEAQNRTQTEPGTAG